MSYIYIKRQTLSYRLLSVFVAITFTFSLIVSPVQSQQTVLNLPQPGMMVMPSSLFNPTMMKGIKIFPDNPLRFDFIVDMGDENFDNQLPPFEKGGSGDLENKSQKLIKYFLAALTTPEEDMWVNLSPYEKDRIIPTSFGQTEMGRDLLAQDYILKQLTASLMYPEDELGETFWDKIFEKAYEMYGTTDIPINTFNKVWIMPEKAVVYENEDTAFVVESKLKVMLEEDYLAMEHNSVGEGSKPSFNNSLNQLKTTDNLSRTGLELVPTTNNFQTEIIRNVILPAIEKEVNQGKHFANLRQIYHALILATWFKMNLKESLLGQIYVDQNKIAGVNVKDKDIKQKIYQQYLDAFKEGVYDYIKEDFDPGTQQIIPRKYFSGGVTVLGISSSTLNVTQNPNLEQREYVENTSSSSISVLLSKSQKSSSSLKYEMQLEGASSSIIKEARELIVGLQKDILTGEGFKQEKEAVRIRNVLVSEAKQGNQQAGELLQELGQVIVERLEKFVETDSLKELASFKKKQDMKGRRKITALLGGTGMASFLTPVLNKINLPNGVDLVGGIGNMDDGGNSYENVMIINEAGRGIIPPTGDKSNTLSGRMSKDKRVYLMGDSGRFTKNQETPVDLVTGAKQFIEKTIVDINKVGLLEKDFLYFSRVLLRAVKHVDEMNAEQRADGQREIPVVGASIRNMYQLGFLREYGVILDRNKQFNEPAVQTEEQQMLFKEAIDSMALTAGVEDTEVMDVSFDPRTLFAEYQGYTLLLQSEIGGENHIRDVIIEKIGETRQIRIVVPSLDYKITLNENEFIDFSAVEKRLIGIQITFHNNRGEIELNIEGQLWHIDETDINDIRLIQVDTQEIIHLADDGTGRRKDLVGTKEKTPIFQINRSEGNQLGIFLRSKLIKMQTNITENVNDSRIKRVEFLKGLGYEGEVPSQDFLEKQEINSALLKRIEDSKEGDVVIVGPGSFFTSILPLFYVQDLPEALVAAKKRGVKIIFILNAVYDNETVNISIVDLLEELQKAASLNFDEMFSHMVGGEYVDLLKMDQAFQDTIHPSIEAEIRTDPSLPSDAAKKVRGLLMLGESEIESIRSLWPNIEVEVIQEPFDRVTVPKRKGGSEDRIFYNVDQTAEVFDRIFGNDKRVDLEKEPLDSLLEGSLARVILADFDNTMALKIGSDDERSASLYTQKLINLFIKLGGEFQILTTRTEENVRGRLDENVLLEGLGEEDKMRWGIYERFGGSNLQNLIHQRAREGWLSKEKLEAVVNDVIEEMSLVLREDHFLAIDGENQRNKDLVILSRGDINLHMSASDNPVNQDFAILTFYPMVERGEDIREEFAEILREKFPEDVFITIGGKGSINLSLVDKADLVRERYLKKGFSPESVVVVDDEGGRWGTGFGMLSLSEKGIVSILVGEEDDLPDSIIRAERKTTEALDYLLVIEIAKRLAEQIQEKSVSREKIKSGIMSLLISREEGVEKLQRIVRSGDFSLIENLINEEIKLSSSPTQEVGGIDFNPENLNLETQGKGMNYNAPIDPQLLEDLTSSPIEGFSPVIFNIMPIMNLPSYLGLKGADVPFEKTQDEDLNSVSFMDNRRYRFYANQKMKFDFA